MAQTLKDEIIKVLEDTRAEIQARMQARNINASGRTSASLRVVDETTVFRLVGGGKDSAPFPTVEVGRGPGGVPGGFKGEIKTGKYAGKPDVSNTFKYILIKWAEEKGIADFGWGQATVAGRRIAYEGTKRNKAHEDIYSTAVNNAKTKLRDVLQRGLSQTLRSIVGGGKVESAQTHF